MSSQVLDRMQADIRNAMISKDSVKRDCLRFVISDIKNLTVNAGKEVTDDIVIKCIQKSVKQHQDSIKQFQDANRQDLLEKEQAELRYLNVYLPKMASEEDTVKVINQIITTVEPVKKNMGVIMKQLPKDIDRKIASKILQGVLK